MTATQIKAANPAGAYKETTKVKQQDLLDLDKRIDENVYGIFQLLGDTPNPEVMMMLMDIGNAAHDLRNIADANFRWMNADGTPATPGS